MIQQTVTRVLWGLAATGVAMFASSCASPPGQEDGLIGLVYHAVDRDHHKAKPTVVYSQPKAVEPIPQPAAMEPAPAHREPVPYRTSPGDVLQVSYFRRPPGNDVRMYHVESLDVLTIHVAGDQHYSTDVTVRPDGRITFFEIGDVDVRGMTIQDVRGALLDRFHEVVPSAEISVFLKKGNGLVDDFLQTLMSDREGTMRTLKVRHDGRVGLPLVGEIEVVGRTLPELSEELEKRYDEVFRGAISVTVNMISSTAGNVAILGEVRQPGIYTLQQPVHPMYALAMAGGALYTAGVREALLIRQLPEGGTVHFRVDLKPTEMGRRDVPMMEPQDILVLPKSGVANANQFIEQYIQNMIPVRLGVGFSYDLNTED